MAGGFKDFTAATALSADVDNYLMRQSVMRFASTAARDSALSGNLEEGMHCVCLDTDSEFYYDGSNWLKWRTPWTAYTPAWTHLTIGNAVVNAAYRYEWGDLWVRGHATLGTTTSGDGSSILQTIPNSETSDASIGSYGSGAYNDGSGPRIYPLVVGVAPGDTAIQFFHSETSGVFTSASPVTIASTDVLTWTIKIPLV